MADESGAFQSVGKVVPSVYYDLIARVCAGVPFLALLLWAQRESFKDLVSSAWIGFILLLGAGYLAGLLLTSLSLLWSALIGLPARTIFRMPTADWRHGSRNDEIAAKDKEAGATLAKMQAEATLCQNLLSGFLVLLIANDTGTFSVSALSAHGPMYRWVIFLALLAAAVFRTVAYLGRQNSLYKIYLPKKVHP
jgi:hypothetical protein